MSGRENELQSDTYDRFKEYVHKKMRNSDNPDLSTIPITKLHAAGVTHMRIPLCNVRRGTEDWYVLVREFAPGSKLVTEPNIMNGGQTFIANVPWTAKKHKKHHSHYSDDESSANLLTPMLWGFALMTTIAVASWTTDIDQWRYVLGL